MDDVAGLADGEWRSRPWLAVLVRVAAYGVPVLSGSVIAHWLSHALSDWSHPVVSTVAVLASAITVSLVVSRLTTRLLPLAVLLRMTMIFPDQAPSRFKVARRTTSSADITARLASPLTDERDAATTMLALVTALGRHDRQTRGHSERVRLFTDLVSEQLAMSQADAGRLRWAALIHDIGKLQVPAGILNKRGKPDDAEWKVLQSHPDAGARLAAPLADWLGPWFDGIAHHHERYDGTGYPRGLAGDQISYAGRIVAVVDAFETMTAARSYKAARSTLSARAELARCAGAHFDPAVVRAFLAIALPRLLWAVGPLAFLVNVPLLRWVGEGGVRLGDVIGTTAVGAANVAGVSALAVAVTAAPTATPLAAHIHGHGHHHGRRPSTASAVSTRTVPTQPERRNPSTGADLDPSATARPAGPVPSTGQPSPDGTPAPVPPGKADPPAPGTAGTAPGAPDAPRPGPPTHDQPKPGPGAPKPPAPAKPHDPPKPKPTPDPPKPHDPPKPKPTPDPPKPKPTPDPPKPKPKKP